MARVGGRNASFAWIVGVACAAVVAGLVWLAAPLLPASLLFVDEQVNPPTSEPVAGDADDTAEGAPAECRDLYVSALWSSLTRAEGSVLTVSTDAPQTTAAGLVDALGARVQFTCVWVSEQGTVSTTVADVPSDAGAILESALPALGFSCDTVRERVRCTLDAGDRSETIEVGGGVWLSSVLDQWQPAQYASRTAERVWAD